MSETPTSYKSLVAGILDITNLAISAIFALVLLVIIYKVFDAWVINGGDSKKREDGQKFAMIGAIVLVVMISVWALVALIKNTLF